VTFRAFLSADLVAPPTLEGLARELRATKAPVKLVDLSTLHLTLKFLGDTPEASVDGLVSGMATAVAGEGPFEARLRGIGALPDPRRVNVIYVGVEDGGRLAGIVRKLEEVLSRQGFPTERRPWLPHATIARVKGGAQADALRRVIEAHAEDDFGTQTLTAIRLKKSVLSVGGPTYSDVAVELLRGGVQPPLA